MSDRLPESVLVTGGHGLIGRHVIRALAERGVSVVAPYLPGFQHDEALPARSLPLDLEDTPRLTSTMDGCDGVVHLAARSGGIQFQEEDAADVLETNQRLTRSVLTAAHDVGARRVYLASSGVIYRPADEPLTEAHPVLGPSDNPSSYALSKLSDEDEAAKWADDGAIEPVIGRFSNVYGPGASFDPSRSTVVHALVRRAVEASGKEPLTVWGDGSAIRSFVHVTDAARAVVAILELGESGSAYNVDTGEAVSIGQIAATVRDLVDPSMELLFDEDKPSGDPFRVLDASRLHALGFRHKVSLSSGVLSVIEAFRSGC